jgi:hypothetical protein
MSPDSSLNHQVPAKGEALKCGACHGPSGIMDFRALGYKDERIKKLIQNY